ncbi:hypothetical protein OG535_03035 [Kitasatospora sp. NBC_00085]|uniref:hypothetical protein n=1 Tax=unclassified Kitasatospora TaxID=2633591 RepID=UPI002F918B0B
MRKTWDAQRRRTRLERTRLDILIAEAEDPFQEGGWLDIAALRRELRGRDRRVGAEEVAEALVFLASPRVGVIEAPAHGYRAPASVDAALQRVQVLAGQWAAESHEG